MAITYNPTAIVTSVGARYRSVSTIGLDDSYPTGGYPIDHNMIGLTEIEQLNATANGGGFVYDFDLTNSKLKVYEITASGVTVTAASAGTPAGTNGTSAVTGTGTFTGTAPLAALNYASPVFSGTGQSSSGQVITTTDNQTMTADQCAGMWFVSATHGPYLIASNTNVAGAPAVLTIYGTAPTTDVGTYKILKSLTPVGTVSALSGTAAAQTFTGALMSTHTHATSGTADYSEVGNGDDLSAVTDLQIVAFGQG